MLISPSSSRNELVLRSFWRMRVSLCWTRGWSTTLTLPAAVILFLSRLVSKDRTVAVHADGRGAVWPALPRQLAAGAPGAPLEDLGQGELVGREAQLPAHLDGGTVEQRDGQRAPLDHQRRR